MLVSSANNAHFALAKELNVLSQLLKIQSFSSFEHHSFVAFSWYIPQFLCESIVVGLAMATIATQ